MNDTTMMLNISGYFPDDNCNFTPYYSDGFVRYFAKKRFLNDTEPVSLLRLKTIEYIAANLLFETLLNGPEMHRWHHADKDEKALNKYFGTKFAVWDWIFGTAYFPHDKKPPLRSFLFELPKKLFY